MPQYIDLFFLLPRGHDYQGIKLAKWSRECVALALGPRGRPERRVSCSEEARLCT